MPGLHSGLDAHGSKYGEGCPDAIRRDEADVSLIWHRIVFALLGAWRSLVARTVRDGEVPGSNPGAPMQVVAESEYFLPDRATEP